MPEEAPWLQAIETEIVERLKTVITGVPVDAMPEKGLNVIHPKGMVLVMFTGINPGQTLDMYTSIQEATLTYEVFIMARSLRDHTGLYPLIKKTLDGLLGWKPAMGKPLRLDKANPTGQEDGAWGFAMTFSTQTMLVPCQEDPDASAPPMNNISFANCGSNECEDC